MSKSPGRSRFLRVGALVAFAVLVVAACGSSGTTTSGSTTVQTNSLFKGDGVEILPKPPAGQADNPDAGAGTPQRGGKVTIALQAEDANGYCLPEAQLDAAGMQVAGSVYDTLVRPDANGDMVPYLAKSFTHNDDYTTWTITLRPNIKFSDGSPLDAKVLKNNLDAYRGTYPGISALLFQFVFSDIASVDVAGPLSVKVTMTKPWRSFEAQFSNRRVGILGQAQLDDDASCAKKLVGTGPFKLTSWQVNQRYVLKPNPHYWRKGPNGEKLPYLSELDYEPIADSQTMMNAFQSGRVDVMMTTFATNVLQARKLAKEGKARVISSVNATTMGFLMLNSSKPPFDDYNMRLAANEAVDFKLINAEIAHNLTPLAAQPWTPGQTGYAPNLTRIPYNLANAKKLVAAYTKAKGHAPKLVINSTQDPVTLKEAQVVRGMLQKAGFEASVASVDQAELISSGIAGKFQLSTWRGGNRGASPSQMYVWWHGGSAVNFARFKDPIIDCLLDVGKSGPSAAGCLKDPALNSEYNTNLPKGFAPLNQISPTDEDAIYKAISLEFRKKAWNIWGAYTAWTFATKPDVHGIFGPDNPDGSKRSKVLSMGTPVATLWVAK